MDKKIIIKHTISEKTLSNVSTYLLLSGRIKFYITIVVVVFSVNILTNIPYNGLADMDYSTYIPFLFIPLLLGLILFSIRRSAKKSILNNPRFYTNLTYTLSSEDFKSEGDGFQSTYPWKDIVKIKQTSKWFLLYINKAQAIVIDKSQLDPWQKDELDTLFNSLASKVKLAL